MPRLPWLGRKLSGRGPLARSSPSVAASGREASQLMVSLHGLTLSVAHDPRYRRRRRLGAKLR